MQEILDFYKNKRVLVTGHTGFKGSWMCEVLLYAGAQVYGYALEPPTDPSLFAQCKLSESITSYRGDICDLDRLMEVFLATQPEIVIHMAAQPIVRESYKNPVGTYKTNVMGTVNLLECARLTQSVKSIINVTTDKVYLNREWEWGYREIERLNGYDPYSNSKSCSELVTDSYRNSFFGTEGNRKLAVSTMRAGNVIGGGDYAADRIIPDCIRAGECGKNISIRNPHSIRPFQHVLEPLMAYLMVAKAQYENIELQGAYNVGPDEKDCLSTGELATIFCREWELATGKEISWINQFAGGPHEAAFLKLDCSKIKRVFGWHPRWNIGEAVKRSIEVYLMAQTGGDVRNCMREQICEFL